MTEFVIILPALLMLMLAIGQLGIAFNNYVTITDAVRAGARQASVGRSVADPTGSTISRVRASASTLDQAKLTVTVTSPWTQGSDVTVCANYPLNIKILNISVSNKTISSCTTERVE